MSKLARPDIEILRCLAREAGRAIMSIYGGGFSVTEKYDQSPVTDADLVADRIICSGLATAFPNIPIISEESISSGVEFDRFFLVDPLDGTKEFIKRNGEFTVNIAFVEDSIPVLGVVYAPALDEMYYGEVGLGSWKECEAGCVALQLQEDNITPPLRVIASRSHHCEQLTRWLEDLSCEYEFVPAGSSLKFCRIAEGRADIYPRFQPTSQWDTAAGQCVLEQAGGTVTEISGKRLVYGIQRPLLNPAFIATNKCFSGYAVSHRGSSSVD